MANPHRPNLFSLSQKELSHDAFFCWVLEWAFHKGEDDLYELSQKFLRLIYGSKASLKETPKKQYQNIDIFLTLDNDEYVIIENKTNSKVTNEQIEVYKKRIAKDKKIEDSKIKTVLIVSGNHFLDHITAADKIIKREDLKQFFKPYVGHHPFINEFYEHLYRMDENYNQWKIRPIKDWDFDCLDGFFQAFYEGSQIKEIYKGHETKRQLGLIKWDITEGLCFELEALRTNQGTLLSLYIKRNIVSGDASKSGSFLEFKDLLQKKNISYDVCNSLRGRTNYKTQRVLKLNIIENSKLMDQLELNRLIKKISELKL
jgi:hypothetical protein